VLVRVISCQYVLRAFVLFCFFRSGSLASAEELKPDTVHARSLHEVEVNGHQLQILRASLPVQIISGKELTTLNAANVSDIARYFSGATIKDYGGIGGMKTVSLRGMGAQYTGVSYDGVIMSDIQSGQIDLGRFPLDNIAEVSITNGQPNDIFQSARLFSSGGVLCLKTKFTDDNKDQSCKGKVLFKTGSSGLLNPGVFITKNVGEKWAFNLSADALAANGKYTFLQYYGSTNNLSQELNRTNSDVKSLRTETNAIFHISSNESISLKANYVDSERGLPGSITFYNTNDSQQRLKDKSFFAQLHYENLTSEKFQHQYFARINISDNRFRDTDPKYTDTGGILTDNYLQKEYYLSSSFQYKLLNSLFISSSADWWYNDLNIYSNVDFKNFQFPTRHTGMANIAAKYFTEYLTLGANLLYTLTRENVRTGVPAPDRDKLSPTINISYKLLEENELRVRAFYKNIFRLPTFNDLYYQDMGNQNLRPEDAGQFDMGFTYQNNRIPFLSEFALCADGYYNLVKDKIIAVPRDMFHWSMINKDKVNILGMDVSVKASTSLGRSGQLRLKGNYSFQSARDATPGSDNYGEQIPYTPVSSGSGSLTYQHGKWETGYNMIFSGVRWTGQMTDPRNEMDGYIIHSVFISRTYKKWYVNAEVIDLFNSQYEVVKFYPMPRRNFRITISMNLGS